MEKMEEIIMKGINTYGIKVDERLAASCRARGGLCYGNKISKKGQKIHIVLRNPLNTHAVLPTTRRCECGGHTFSAIWGGDKFVCHHCGKQYFAKEFEHLTEKGLERDEVEDRKIFAMLLDGGDLREHAEENVLVLKDRNGIPGGTLPLGYEEHLAKVYKKSVYVVTMYHKAGQPSRQNSLAVTGMGAV